MRIFLILIFGFTYLSLIAQSENCANGIDDNGDGLIDCFDPLCSCLDLDECSDFYFQPCDLACPDENAGSPIILQEFWKYNSNTVNDATTPIVGDIDNDGENEVIVIGSFDFGSYTNRNFIILNGITGNLEQLVLTAELDLFYAAVAIADVDKNGYADIFLNANDGRIYCYEYNGTEVTEKWRSDPFINDTPKDPSFSMHIADFNYDGIAEIYTLNKVFSSMDGSLIVQGLRTNSVGAIQTGDERTVRPMLSIAADVLNDNFCDNCAGLELIAGNQVYSIDINTQEINIEVELIAPYFDGYTSIADMDGDGDQDAVVITRKQNQNRPIFIYVWDLQTSTVLAELEPFNTTFRFSQVSASNLIDIDLDNRPEIVFARMERESIYTDIIHSLNLLKLNNGQLEIVWDIEIEDNSGATNMTTFDFNGDDIFEIVHRDEKNVLIIDSRNGNILSSTPCSSRTAKESPIVVDLDLDGDPEIVCSCSNSTLALDIQTESSVVTRPVWNQYRFFNTHINDDLTVPEEQQKNHLLNDRVLNSFMVQSHYKKNDLPEAEIKFISTSCTTTNSEEINIHVEICNSGLAPLLPNTPMTIYAGNPTNYDQATPISTNLIGIELPPNSCDTLNFIIDINSSSSLFYAIINDNGSIPSPFDLTLDFPSTSTIECDYENNINSIIVDNYPITIDSNILSYDTIIDCVGERILFQGQSYSSDTTIIYRLGTSACDSIIQTALIFNLQGVNSAGESCNKVEEYEIYIPTAFTPNNDGTNDSFTIFTNDANAVVEHLLIYNRWGNKIFENQLFMPGLLSQGWNGLYKGDIQDSGVFIYYIRIKMTDQSIREFSGDISLIQ